MKRISKADEKRIEKGLEPIEDEDTAQKKVVQYLELLKLSGKVIHFTSIPNSTYTKSWKQKAKNKAMGLRPGMCDLVIIYRQRLNKIPGFLGLEMKREKGGVVSDEQMHWINTLNEVPGVLAMVANGFDHAKIILDSLIG